MIYKHLTTLVFADRLDREDKFWDVLESTEDTVYLVARFNAELVDEVAVNIFIMNYEHTAMAKANLLSEPKDIPF
jgi:hypothetical protein